MRNSWTVAVSVVAASSMCFESGCGRSAVSNLAPGTACNADGQCESHLCGTGDGGNCCSMACSKADAICGATGCDSSGACTFPSTAIKCATSCIDSLLTISSCNGTGACTTGTPTACPNSVSCKDATSCNVLCVASGDCSSGFYCDTSTGQCAAEQAVGPCSVNDACTSGVCGIFGSGNCCTAQCSASTDPACNPSECDATSGACIYPVGHACGTTSCASDMLSAGQCDAAGACGSVTAACPNNLKCNNSVSCLAACGTSTDCTATFYCNAGVCGQQTSTGPCTENDDCSSGVCDIHGRGNCCISTCNTEDPLCGASGCSETGSCVYPGTDAPCGSATTCVADALTDAFVCDGAGHCPTPASTSCAPYACSTSGVPACLATCQDDTACVPGSHCEASFGTCCSLAKGGSIAVDSSAGNDDGGCCGVSGAAPCQTLTRAMALVDAMGANGVTVVVTVDGGVGNWLPAGEVYPIVLGWGVEVSAPGVFFFDPNGDGGIVFDIAQYSANDLFGSASLFGTAAGPVGIGMTSDNGQQTPDSQTIVVEQSGTLYLANASINGSAGVCSLFGPSSVAITINGGSVWFGQDQSASVSGTVNIGNTLGQFATDGCTGIVCVNGPSVTGPPKGLIQDVPLPGQSALVIQGQEGLGMDLVDCNVTLTADPIIGLSPSSVGFGTCPNKTMYSAIWASGSSNVTFSNGTIQCMSYPGVFVFTNGGIPSVTVDNTVVQNTWIGIYAIGGVTNVSNSLFRYNSIGVEQDSDGEGDLVSIDMSGGGNIVECSSNVETAGMTAPGIGVYNTTGYSLNASNVAWDTAGPDYFQCDSAFATCACNIASCAVSPGVDGMDAVEDSTNLGGVVTVGNTLSPDGCN